MHDPQLAMLGQVPPSTPVATAPVPVHPDGYQSPLAAQTVEVESSERPIQPNDVVYQQGSQSRTFVVRTVDEAAGTATVVNNNGCGCGGSFTYQLSDLIRL